MNILEADLRQTVARAALAVTGVSGLQPSLSHRLASAAALARQTAGIGARYPEAGVQAEHALQPSGWHLEVRCILNEERRICDTARDVRRQVRAAAAAYLASNGTFEPVTVLVTITHITHPAS